MADIKPLCTGCNKHPDQLIEYIDAAGASNMTPDDYVRRQEGTYNVDNGHFLCTSCYIEAGEPTLPFPDGWKAP